MTPLRAIKTGFAKSLTFRGRTSRAEFWWFAPVGFAVPLSCALYLPPDVSNFGSLLAKMLLSALAAIPFDAAVSRRFHDVGEPHDEFWRGIGPTLGVVFFGFWLVFGLFAVATIWGILFGLLIAIPSFLLFIACLFLAPGTLGSTIGQLLLPSQPGPNRYGPNPHEVQS
jgi:uncharacterized membrane protein YhaH (DUF805 family)